MNPRDTIDLAAWQGIHVRPVQKLARALGNRSRNYGEIEAKLLSGVEFEHAWSDLLHAFYDSRDASFFAHPSPPSLSREWQALLAGSAEWLSAEFGLPHPQWVDEPQYFLPRPWNPVEDLGIDPAEFIDETLRSLPEAFRRRNVAFASRNLIAL